MQHAAQPEEIGEVVAFLASPRASYITGVTVAVIEANGVRFADRRFGNPVGTPSVWLQHVRRPQAAMRKETGSTRLFALAASAVHFAIRTTGERR